LKLGQGFSECKSLKCGDVVCATLPFLQCLPDEIVMQRLKTADNLHIIFKTGSSDQQNSNSKTPDKTHKPPPAGGFQTIQRGKCVMLGLFETSDVLKCNRNNPPHVSKEITKQ